MTNALYPRLYGFVIWIELVVISRRVGFGRRDFFLGRIFISLLKTMNILFFNKNRNEISIVIVKINMCN